LNFTKTRESGFLRFWPPKKQAVTRYLVKGLLWRGDLSPLDCAAVVKVLGLLRSPTGINPLATEITNL
jgi:hypothetical protein